MKILLCTDGSPTSMQSVHMLARLSFPPDTTITVLGVSVGQDDLQELNASMDSIDDELGKKHLLTRLIRQGDPAEEIISEALQQSYDLVALGSGGGRSGLLPAQLGSTASKLARQLHTHYLICRGAPASISRILVCAGPESASNITMKLGGNWIAGTMAEVCLLHVIAGNEVSNSRQRQSEKIAKDSSNQDDLGSDALLDQTYQQLQKSGVVSKIVPKIRHGLVVDEVVKELSQGNYDLLVIGAHYQPGLDLWQGTLWDDVTDRLLTRSTCSVLII